MTKPAKKPTRFVSNGWCLLEELCRRCPGDHSHQPLMGGRAAAAAEYPDDLCHAVCRGLVRQKQYEKESSITLPRRGRSELKHMLKRLTESYTTKNTTSRIDATDQTHVHTKAGETHACGERDLDLFATRADRYREKRRRSNRRDKRPRAGLACVTVPVRRRVCGSMARLANRRTWRWICSRHIGSMDSTSPRVRILH